MNKRKSLSLVLIRKWYDMIESGEKKEEYRELTPYWLKRIFGVTLCSKNGELSREEVEIFLNNSSKELLTSTKPKPFELIDFAHAYARTRDTMAFRFDGVRIGTGRPEWGAKEGRKYFVISIGPEESELKKRTWHELR